MKKTFALATATAVLLTMTGCFMNEEPEVSELPTDSVVMPNSVSQSATSENTSSDESESMSNVTNSNESDESDPNMHNVEIINDTGSSIYGLSHSATGLEEWGETLYDDPIEHGSSANINIPRGEADARYDLRVYDNDKMEGDGWIFPDIDFTRDGRIILRYKEDAPDYIYGDDYDKENTDMTDGESESMSENSEESSGDNA